MKKYFLGFVLILFTTTILAQANDPVVMTINGKDVKKSEFEYIYNKNNNEDALDKRSLDEYITLFRNFKLRVAEAETQGMDTTVAFHKELKEYRTQLAKSYLETEKDSRLVEEAYNRSNEWSEISAIFVNFPQLEEGAMFFLTPADTLATYKKAIDIRNQALKKGANFEELVKQYTFDERSKGGDRPGYLGWFSGMRLAPVLEMALSNTAVGTVSMPVRMPQGYYLLKVHNKKLNPGEVNAAHILISTQLTSDDEEPMADAETRLAEVVQKLQGGVDFDELAKEYSQDPGSAQNGGNLSWFSFGQMVPEFNEVVFSMKEIGEVSQPVKTQFGYHIIKLLGKRQGASLDDLRAQIENKLERTGQFNALHQAGLNKWKAEYNYRLNDAAYKKLSSAASQYIPTDSVYISMFEKNSETLLTIDGKNNSIAGFIAYIQANPRAFSNLSTEMLQEKLDAFVYQELSDTEDRNLENKYPEFKNLMQEYRDGILLFEVSNKEVWEKASTDTEGLENFFAQNTDKYKWNELHWKGYIILTKDAKQQKKMEKEVKKMSYEKAAKYLMDNYKQDVDSLSKIKVEKGLFVKGQNKYVDEKIFNTGKAELPEKYTGFFLVGINLPNTPESYTDVRGLVITDYQDYLEKRWLDELNAKYPVEIYKDRIEN